MGRALPITLSREEPEMKLATAILLFLLAFGIAFWFRIMRIRPRLPAAPLPDVVVLLTEVEARSALLSILNRGAAPVTVGSLDIAVLQKDQVVRETRWSGGQTVAPGQTAEIPVDLPVGPLEPGEYRYGFRYGTHNLGFHAVIVE